MRPIDWAVVIAYLIWVVGDGLRQARRSKDLEGFMVASRSLPWWMVGLSVMATQLSAITMIGTTGQAYINGMRFLQNYYALPIAMIILSATLVPFFHRASVFTAYQYLEQRFDSKTRTFTALLFLFSRSLSCSVIISAPAVVMSVILGLSVTQTCLLIGIPTTIFTMFGGVRAVAYTDVKQMFAVIISLVSAVVFLILSYFGTDQSQVQRYLAAKSVDEARSSLLMSAFWKIPLQALVLIVGVFMFTFYLFAHPPMLFNPVHEQQIRESARAADYAALEQEFDAAIANRRTAAEQLAASDDTTRADKTAR